jgi:hypothetical protein
VVNGIKNNNSEFDAKKFSLILAEWLTQSFPYSHEVSSTKMKIIFERLEISYIFVDMLFSNKISFKHLSSNLTTFRLNKSDA